MPDLLDRHPSDTDLLARAGRLLVRMGCSRDDPTNLLAYRDALRVYDGVVGRAGLLPPTLDNAAMLLSLALDLSSGTGVLLEWPPGRRAVLLESLGRLLAEPRWAVAGATASTADQRRRADWIRRTGRQPFKRPATPDGFRVEVVAGDPADREPVEARVLIDGRPVVPAVFGRGPVHSPDHLLDEGRLRAGAEPREVQLAEAYCTEGCCGALYVTIRRDADQVVWENWRQTMPGSREPAPELPAYRFDASAYDTEIARAETDCSWSWRTRTVARLIKAGLIEEPDVLSRWDASRDWISSGFDDPDTAVVTFWYVPGLASGSPERADSPLQFRWVIRDDGTPPEAQAAAALRRLAEEDPKSYATVCGGSRERAEELGFPGQPRLIEPWTSRVKMALCWVPPEISWCWVPPPVDAADSCSASRRHSVRASANAGSWRARRARPSASRAARRPSEAFSSRATTNSPTAGSPSPCVPSPCAASGCRAGDRCTRARSRSQRFCPAAPAVPLARAMRRSTATGSTRLPFPRPRGVRPYAPTGLRRTTLVPGGCPT